MTEYFTNLMIFNAVIIIMYCVQARDVMKAARAKKGDASETGGSGAEGGGGAAKKSSKPMSKADSLAAQAAAGLGLGSTVTNASATQSTMAKLQAIAAKRRAADACV